MYNKNLNVIEVIINNDKNHRKSAKKYEKSAKKCKKTPKYCKNILICVSKNGNILSSRRCKHNKIENHIKYGRKMSAVSRGNEKIMCKILDRLENKKSEELIQEFGLDKQIPVNLNELLDSYGIALCSTDFSELKDFPNITNEVNKRGQILGAVATKNDELRILYRKSDSIHRQKFTIAHELAHCCLNTDLLRQNGHIEYRKDIEYPDDRNEYNANIFAGELLIPTEALKKIYEKVPCPVLSELATAFDVSTNVMRERLKYLGFQYKERTEIKTYFNNTFIFSGD